MKKIIISLIILSLLRHLSFSQNQHRADSLTNELKSHKQDTTTANILYALSKAHWGNNPDKAMEYGKQSLTLSEKINDKKGIAKAYYRMTIIHADGGDNPE